MRTQILLVDAAQADQSGKAHALGIGWNVTGTPTPPMALLILIEVGWHEANQRHSLRAELQDEDGHPVLIASDTGEDTRVVIQAEYEVGRPPGSVPGVPLNMPIVFNIGGGIPLVAGRRYRWQVENSGQPDTDLSLGFYVRPD